MGTGGTPSLNHRNGKVLFPGRACALPLEHLENCIGFRKSLSMHMVVPLPCGRVTPCACVERCAFSVLRSSPRPISTGQLNTLLRLHLRPINLVVFKGSYFFRMGDLILRSASRLDAFSVYPLRTWLPSYAVGTTTDSPLVRPSRSSRTKDSSSQISCAHDG